MIAALFCFFIVIFIILSFPLFVVVLSLHLACFFQCYILTYILASLISAGSLKDLRKVFIFLIYYVCAIAEFMFTTLVLYNFHEFILMEKLNLKYM